MAHSKLRMQITWQAARLMYERQESEYYQAKMKAARLICQGWVKPADLPSNAEIRDEIQTFARIYEGASRDTNLMQMRLEALRVMRLLAKFKPRLIGSVLTGHVRQGSDIDLHVFTSSVEAVTSILDHEHILYDIVRKRVRKHGEETLYTHIQIKDRFPVELTLYPSDKSHYVFKSSITGKAIERASLRELEQWLPTEYPNINLDDEIEQVEQQVDRFQVFESLLLPLENVKQQPKYHPEGDALYHSLQVFDLACDELPYDEEFLLAAILHDVGKGVDPHDHVHAGLEALEGFISERTEWLIEHHMVAHKILDGTIGFRARKRLEANDSYDELLLLSECDRDGRAVGVDTTELDDALEYIRSLSYSFG